MSTRKEKIAKLARMARDLAKQNGIIVYDDPDDELEEAAEKGRESFHKALQVKQQERAGMSDIQKRAKAAAEAAEADVLERDRIKKARTSFMKCVDKVQSDNPKLNRQQAMQKARKLYPEEFAEYDSAQRVEAN